MLPNSNSSDSRSEREPATDTPTFEPPAGDTAVKLTSPVTFVQSAIRTAPSAAHKLNRPGSELMWSVRPITLTDFVNQPDYDYEIVKDYISSPLPEASITISRFDRIEITVDGDNILLTHTRDGKSIGRGTNFVVEPNNRLWAVGTATVPPSTAPVGEYILYLVEDTVNSRHTNAMHLHESIACAQVHFEYFDATDAQMVSHRPELGKNVFSGPVAAGLETDEGDGDEGRRR